MLEQDLTERLKAEAWKLGIDQVGIAPAVTAPGYPHFLRWLGAGHDAGMDYLRRQEPGRSNPSFVFEGVRSIVIASVVYGDNEVRLAKGPASPTAGKVARYARGKDYHRVLRDKLEQLLDWLKRERPESSGRAVVDTAPLLERDYARLAGIGWIGKNTMLINRKLGSFTFLGALLTDLELGFDEPHQANHCGTCTRCLDACPTGAFSGPYELDARRCISYWTIEHRGGLADEEAANLHGWVFGCDICQDVCPWNRKAPSGRLDEFRARPEWVDPDLIEWLGVDITEWRARLKGTALTRTKRIGLVRNAALVLGTRQRLEAVAPLRALLDDPEEDSSIRSAAAWALGRIGGGDATVALKHHQNDLDPIVRESVLNSLRHCEANRRGEGAEPRPARTGDDPGAVGPSITSL